MAEAKNFDDDVYYDEEELVKELSKLEIYFGLTSFEEILKEQKRRTAEAQASLQALYQALNEKQSEDKNLGTLNFFFLICILCVMRMLIYTLLRNHFINYVIV